jgi:hypothetical protein
MLRRSKADGGRSATFTNRSIVTLDTPLKSAEILSLLTAARCLEYKLDTIYYNLGTDGLSGSYQGSALNSVDPTSIGIMGTSIAG